VVSWVSTAVHKPVRLTLVVKKSLWKDEKEAIEAVRSHIVEAAGSMARYQLWSWLRSSSGHQFWAGNVKHSFTVMRSMYERKMRGR
jgi:hypothetical protein